MVVSWELLSLACLVLCGAPLATSQDHSEYPVCAEAGLIAEVPNNPFVADLVEDVWRNLADGSRMPIDSQDSDGILIRGSQSPQVVGIVARDSVGRVFYRKQTLSFSLDPSGKRIQKSQSVGWYEYICDPATKRRTHLACAHSSPHPDRSVAAYTQNAVLSASCEKDVVFAQFPESANTLTTKTWTAWHNQTKGRDNLGIEAVEGVPAYRYRFTLTDREHSLHEIVISDELFAHLVQVAWLQFPTSEFEQKLANIRRNEPDPQLFEIPERPRSALLGILK